MYAESSAPVDNEILWKGDILFVSRCLKWLLFNNYHISDELPITMCDFCFNIGLSIIFISKESIKKT